MLLALDINRIILSVCFFCLQISFKVKLHVKMLNPPTGTLTEKGN